MSDEKTPKTKLDEACEDVKTKLDEACEEVKTKLDEACEDVRAKIDEACEDVRTKIDEACEDVKSMAKGLFENEGMKALLRETKHKLFVAREKLRYLLCKVLTKRDEDSEKEPHSPILRGREAALKEFEGSAAYNSLKILSNLERAVRNVLDRQDSSIMTEETARPKIQCNVVDDQILITDFDTYVAVLETMFGTIVRADHYMQNCLTEDITRARAMASDGCDPSKEIAEMEEELDELGVISQYVSSFQEYMRKVFHEKSSEENAAKEMPVGEEASSATNVIGSLKKAASQDTEDRLNPSPEGTAEDPIRVGSGKIHETTEPEFTCQDLINGVDGIAREMYSRACQLRAKRDQKLLSRFDVTLDQKLPEVPVDQKFPEVPVEKKLPEVPVDQKLPEVPVDQKLPEVPVDQKLSDVPVEKKLPEVPVEKKLTEVPVEKKLPEVPVEQILPEVPVDQKLPEVPVDQKLPEDPVEQKLPEDPVEQILPEVPVDQKLPEVPDDPKLPEDPVDQELIDSSEELSYTDYYDNQSLIDSSDDETFSASPDQLSPTPGQLMGTEFLRNAAAIALTGPLLRELQDAVGRLEHTNETLHRCLERATAASKQTEGKKR